MRATAQSALETRQFRLEWHDEWTAMAERGSKVGNAFAGAFAQYFKVGVAIRSGHDRSSVLRIERQSSGAIGGIMGVSKTNKNMKALGEELEATFGAAGVLVEKAQISG